jgi:multisubunit Na+/H+ antiporter MnhB subunit
MRRSVIFEVVVRAEFHTLVLIALYLLFAGHNQPGGGFTGGLVAGSAIALRWLAAGPGEIRHLLRVAPTTVLGLGLVVAAVSALAPLVVGGAVLDHGTVTVTIPLLGAPKISGVLVFDTGVVLVVVGMVAVLLDALGDVDDLPGSEPAP